MRVVIISDLGVGGRPMGGVERATAALARSLSGAGVDVFVIAPHHGAGPDYEDASYDFRVIRVPMSSRGQVVKAYRPWIAAVHEQLIGLEPDIVQGQGLLHNGAAAAMWDRCPTVVAAHGSPIADARWGYPLPVALALTPLLKSVITRTVRQATAVINVIDDWRVNLPVEPDRMEHIPNPVEEVFFHCSPPPDVPVVRFLGGPRKIKGLDMLLRAWPHVRKVRPDAELLLYGVHSNTPTWLAAKERLEGVKLEAPLSIDEVAQAMSSGGVVVLPSRYEVAPIVILEAWAIGLPVVATDVGGMRRLADESAFIVKPDPEGIARGIIRALRGDSEVHARVLFGKGAAEIHRPGLVAGRHLELYRDLTGL